MSEAAATQAHARYGASNSARWLLCPGSVYLIEKAGKPRTSSRYAAEGTGAHTLAERCLTNGKDADHYIGDVLAVEGFEFTIDDDFADAVQTYLDEVRELADGADYVGFEQRVHYHQDIGCEPGEGFGTSDAVIVKGRELHVADLKFGRGGKVSAEDNTQLGLYALGALRLLTEDAALCDLYGIDASKIDKVVLHIMQPRVSKNPRTAELSLMELQEMANTLRTGVERCLDARLDIGSPTWWADYTAASDDTCRYCDVRSECPTARDSVASTVFGAEPSKPEDFADLTVQAPTFESDPAWLAAAMDKVDEIEGWCTAIRTEAEARMHNGTGVTGWKLVEGKRPARRWDNPEEAEAMLTTFRLKHEERYVYKAISPTRAEKLATVSAKDAKAGIKPTIGARQWAKLEPLINRGTPKAHVAPASDPRPAIEIKPVEEMFDVVTPDDASDLV